MSEPERYGAPVAVHGFQLRNITLGDDAEPWETIGFSIDRTGAGPARVCVGGTTITLTGSGDGFAGWTIDDIDGALDGLPTSQTTAPNNGPVSSHDNGISRIDHVVINTGDVPRTVAAFEATGLRQRGGRSTTSYGSPMRQAFFWLGDVIAELVGPDDGEPVTDVPTTIFGMAFCSPNLDATLTHLGELGGEPKDAVQPGRRIAGIRGTRIGVSLPLAVMSPHPKH